MRTKSHNFTFKCHARDYKKKSSDLITIIVDYTHGTARRRISTGVRVPRGAWSIKKRVLDLKKYPHLQAQEILLESLVQVHLSFVCLSSHRTCHLFVIV